MNQIKYLNDTVFVFPTALGSAATTDPTDTQLHIYVSTRIVEGDMYFLEIGLRYYRRYSSLHVGKNQPEGYRIQHLSPVIASTFLFPVKAGVKPFKRLQFSSGISPGLHLRRKGFSLDSDRDWELNEPYLAVQGIHRTITFNYEASVEYLISKRISLLVAQQGSIGQISRPFQSHGNTYTVPLKWKSLGFSLMYQFDYQKK